MMQNCRLTHCEEINACRFGKDLIIYGQGDALSGCDVVKVEHSLIDIFPPQFVVVSCRKAPKGVFCTQVVMPMRFSGIFTYPEDQHTVRVGTRDGVKEVAIAACTIQAPLLAAGAAGGAAPEAIGYSPDSYDDAIRNAFANLNMQSNIPDALFTATIIESGYMAGGIVGFHHFFVRVRGRIN